MARKSVATRKYEHPVEGNVRSLRVGVESLTFHWAQGGKDTFDLNDLPAEIVRVLAWHGLSQKLGDSYSDADGDSEYARKQAIEAYGRLKAGEFNAKGEGGSRSSILAEAVAQVMGMEVNAAITALDGMTKEQKATARKHPKVALEIERIKEKRAKEKREELKGKAEEGEDLSSLFGE